MEPPPPPAESLTDSLDRTTTATASPSSSSSTTTNARTQAFSSMVQALQQTVPLLLHGSGDVIPMHVNTETVHLVSCLTAQYIAKLVDASLDSHFTFLDEPEIYHVPPPSFPRYLLPAKPPPFSSNSLETMTKMGSKTSTTTTNNNNNKKKQATTNITKATTNTTPATTATNNNNNNNNNSGTVATGTGTAAGSPSESVPGDADEGDDKKDGDTPTRKRPPRRLREEYWDDGLPTPNIVGKKDASSSSSLSSSPPPSKRRRSLSLTSTAASTTVPTTTTTTTSAGTTVVMANRHKRDIEYDKQQQPQAPIQEWVGVIGVDLRQDMIRKTHVKNAVATPSFVFPICHDVYAYNRVREIRAAKRTLDPLLQDATLQELIQTEGRSHYRHREKHRSMMMMSSSTSSSTGGGGGDDETKTMMEQQDPEDDEDVVAMDEEDGGPEWPGLDYVLPVNKLNNLLG